jgi:hypothetical protein
MRWLGLIQRGRTPSVVRVQNKLARAIDPGSATPSRLMSTRSTGGPPGRARWKSLGRYVGHMEGRETKPVWAGRGSFGPWPYFRV